MRRHLGTIALVFAVALAAAGGGYALGTQSDDGTAAAARSSTHSGAGHRVHRALAARLCHRLALRGRGALAAHRRQRLAALAKRIGVEPAKLRDALRQVRQERIAARRKALAGDLARILGVPESRVEDALTKRRP